MRLASQAFDDILIDIPKGIEAFSLINVLRISPTAEIGSEELGFFLDICLLDHVFHGCVYGIGANGVDFSEAETEETVAGGTEERWRELRGELYCLVLDAQTAESDVVGSYSAGGCRAVSVSYCPSTELKSVEGPALFVIEDTVLGGLVCLRGFRKES